MNYGPQVINKLIAQLDTADTEVLILVMYLLQKIDKQQCTPEPEDLRAIIEVELTKREIDINQI